MEWGGTGRVGWVGLGRMGGVDEWGEVGQVGCDGMGWVGEGTCGEVGDRWGAILHLIISCGCHQVSPPPLPPFHPLS